MISEAAMLLAETKADGGIWTPGAIMGRSLIERLVEQAGLTFTREA
jgi:short subunit dehydrogenase-like uncharacterized protein